MRIGIIQSNPTLGVFEENREGLLAEVRLLAARGAALCVAPAFSLCGLGNSMRYGQEPFLRDSHAAAQQLAKALQAEGLPPLLLGSVDFPCAKSGSPGCCAGKQQGDGVVLLLASGESRPVASREALFPWSCAAGCQLLDNRDCAETGCGEIYVISDDTSLAVAFAEDLAQLGGDGDFRLVPHVLSKISQKEHFQGLVLLGAVPYTHGAAESMEKAVQALAVALDVPVCFVNLSGGTDGIVCFGGSFAASSNGSVIARLSLFATASTVADLSETKALPVNPVPREEAIWTALVTGLRDFVGKCGFTKVALGLSGGIDSALVAALAVDAVGSENVVCLLMPSPYSSQGSIDDSLDLAKKLSVATYTLPITPVFAAYRDVFEAGFPDSFAGLTEENIQSRIRGALMMAYANRFGAMVLATGNKSELAVGYCTLYGDMSGGLAVLGDVYKTTVYELCRWKNSREPGRIPENIILKEPSAELRPEQKDADSLPPYDVLDGILCRIIELGESRERIISAGFAPDDVHRVATLLKRAEFKRHQAPPVIRISRHAFGAQWRMPIAGR